MGENIIRQIEEILNTELFKANLLKKKPNFFNSILNLHHFHYQNSEFYKRVTDNHIFKVNSFRSIQDLPFIPVRMFKLLDLKSVHSDEIIKTLTSSGTTGQTVSKIFLDKETAINQTKVLTKIVSSFLKGKRLPMIIIDSEETIKNRRKFSARTAGILGFSIFSGKRIFALDSDMTLNIERTTEFIKENKGKKIFIFGFTSIIYIHWINELKNQKLTLNLKEAILLHGGGWKKLADKGISNSEFKKDLKETCGIQDVHDYYGMVEQTGSIFMECEQGYFHVSEFSDILIRDPYNFNVVNDGLEGIIQLFSLIPKSYPGHSILTEDLGRIIGEDNCKCGRMGKYFVLNGRIPQAELRGCSNTYEK